MDVSNSATQDLNSLELPLNLEDRIDQADGQLQVEIVDAEAAAEG